MPDSLAISLPAPIAIMSFNRPGMLERVLVSLKAQTLPVAEQRVHLFQDAARNPFGGTSRATEEDIAACIGVFHRHFPDGVVHEAPHNLGIALNFDRAERFFFETLGAELGIFFEDDMVLSPHYLDALERLSAFALAEEKVGYVAAYGNHRALPEEHARRRREIVPMEHNWGFALTRRQWNRQRDIVDGYLALLRNVEYRKRPIGRIREYFAKLGLPALGTSQDKAKEVASAILGTARVMTFPTYGHYIGEIGEHFTTDLYEGLEFGNTVLFDQPPEAFDFPASEMVERMAQQAREALESSGNTHMIASSQERLPPRLFVQTLYWGVLNRDPDPSGFDSSVHALETGTLEPAEVLQNILNSSEFRRKSEPRNAIPLIPGHVEPTPLGSEGTARTTAQDIQHHLFGMDIYAGFSPVVPRDLQGWNSRHSALEREFASRRPRIAIDVGVWKGASTINMAKHLQSLGIDGAVIAVDTFLGSPEHWNRDRPDRIFTDLRLQNGWPGLYWQFLSNIMHEGVSGLVVPLPQTSENAAVILQQFGLHAGIIHIDAAQEYEAVLRDARMYWELLEPGGLLIGSDYPLPGAARAAREFAAEVGRPLQIEEPKWLIEKPA